MCMQKSEWERTLPHPVCFSVENHRPQPWLRTNSNTVEEGEYQIVSLFCVFFGNVQIDTLGDNRSGSTRYTDVRRKNDRRDALPFENLLGLFREDPARKIF